MPGIPPEPVGILGVFSEDTIEHMEIASCKPPRTWGLRVGTAWRCPVCKTGWQLWGPKGGKFWAPVSKFDGMDLKLRDGRIRPPKGPSGVSR